MNKTALLVVLAAALVGCDRAERQLSGQRDNAAYRAAMADYRAGRLKQAVEGFRKVCREDPSNASARFQLACLLLDSAHDHAGAYCAFMEYLLQQPESDKARLARDRLTACEKEFARELAVRHGLAEGKDAQEAAFKALGDKLAAAEKECEARGKGLAEAEKRIAALAAQVKHLKSLVSDSPDADEPARDISDVKALLAGGEDDEASAPPPGDALAALTAHDPDLEAVAPIAQPKDAKEKRAAEKKAAEEAAAAQAAALKAMRDKIPDEYVVEEGDTLYKIATKFYGRSSAWKLIRDANRAEISTDGRVRTGQKLKLPK